MGYANILHGAKQGAATIGINPPIYNCLAIEAMPPTVASRHPFVYILIEVERDIWIFLLRGCPKATQARGTRPAARQGDPPGRGHKVTRK
jgi:hypothetical protein